MSSAPDRTRRYIVLALLFVVGTLALAVVGELTSSPLRDALEDVPVPLAFGVVSALVMVGIAATIAYERVSREPDGHPGVDAPSTRLDGRSAFGSWRPSRRIVTRVTAIVALFAIGMVAVTAGPQALSWLASSITAATTPPWTSEPLHTFQRPVPTDIEDEPDQPGDPRVAFSPDGSRLAASGYTHTVQVWDLESDSRTVLRAGKPPQDIAFSPDGDTLALVGNQGGVDCRGTVELWDLESQRLVEERERPATLYAVAFSPDGKRFAIGGKECESLDGVVEVWNTAGEQRTQHLTHGALVRSVAFGPGGDTLASAGEQWDSGASYSSIRLWDAVRGGPKPEATLEQPANMPVDAFALGPSGDFAVSAGTYWKSPSNGHPEDGSSELVTVWDTEAAQALASAETEDRAIHTLALAPDGNTLAVARQSGQDDEIRVTVELLDTRALDKVESFEVASSSIHSMAFDDSGRRLALATFDGVEVWTRRGGD